MSETTPVETTPPAEPAPVEPAPVPVATEPDPVETPGTDPVAETGPDLAAEVEKWKVLSKKNEARAKANAEKALKFDEIEEANKTELQKLTDRAERAETGLLQAQMLALRAEKSASTGVPLSVIPAGTEDEMDEAIAAFKGALATALDEATKNRHPAAAPAQIVTAAPESTKVKQIASRTELQSMSPQERLDAYRDGRLDGLMGKSS